jgi:hypothetical protein
MNELIKLAKSFNLDLILDDFVLLRDRKVQFKIFFLFFFIFLCFCLFDMVLICYIYDLSI